MSEQKRQPAGPRPNITTRAVREALGGWHDLVALGEHPLARLAVVEQRRLSAGHGAGENGYGLALRQVLAEALATLKPEAEGEPDAADKRWQPYLLLHERYVNEREVAVVADLLGIGASTASRKSTAAIKRVVSTLYAWEQRALSTNEEGIDGATQTSPAALADADLKISQNEPATRRPANAIQWLRRNWSFALNGVLGVAVVALTFMLLSARTPSSTPSPFEPSLLATESDNEPIDVSTLIMDFAVASERPYQWQLLQPERKMYVDRSDFLFVEVPSELEDQPLLVTANDDKGSNADDQDFISFRMQQDTMVYVLYTTNNAELEDAWLSAENGWVAEEAVASTTLPINEKARYIRSKLYEAGSTVQLGGNGGTNYNTSMYNVAVAPVE